MQPGRWALVSVVYWLCATASNWTDSNYIDKHVAGDDFTKSIDSLVFICTDGNTTYLFPVPDDHRTARDG